MPSNNNADKQQGLSWTTPPNKTPVPAAPMTTRPAPAPRGSNTATYAGFIAAGIVVGVLVTWGMGAWRTTSTTATSTSTVGADNGVVPAQGSDPSFLIMSPQQAGTSVTVSKAIVAEPTWIVIYEDNDGKPGNALGAALFFPEHQQGVVELLRATVTGRTYLAAKQVDNGDHKFSLKDDQFLSEGGVVQWITFAVN